MTSLSNNNKFMKDFVTKAVIIMIIVLIAFSLPALNRNQNEEQEISLETFDVNYFNSSDNTVNVRYKYIIGYEHGEIELPDDWDYKKPLFSLEVEGMLKKAEVHWYQCKDIGKVEFKIKRWIDES